MTLFAIVQHSAAGYKDDPVFKKGLETRTVTARLGRQIEDIGGKVFSSYGDAEEYCYNESYPPGVAQLAPQAPGAFSRKKIDGLRVYIPQDS